VIKEGRERVVLGLSLWHSNQSTNSKSVRRELSVIGSGLERKN